MGAEWYGRLVGQCFDATLGEIPEDFHKSDDIWGLLVNDENIANCIEEKGSLWEQVVFIKAVSESAKNTQKENDIAVLFLGNDSLASCKQKQWSQQLQMKEISTRRKPLWKPIFKCFDSFHYPQVPQVTPLCFWNNLS